VDDGTRSCSARVPRPHPRTWGTLGEPAALRETTASSRIRSRAAPERRPTRVRRDALLAVSPRRSERSSSDARPGNSARRPEASSDVVRVNLRLRLSRRPRRTRRPRRWRGAAAHRLLRVGALASRTSRARRHRAGRWIENRLRMGTGPCQRLGSRSAPHNAQPAANGVTRSSHWGQ
jgi:hypothetical protein